ncbi:hypothetical protein AGABI2DRAFT_190209 [Agaricus bisporus var. bisporus H97]|uniref:hypothetical protein n=1 Tax=Agaricus bisporus var. bisporus (strain H97 / ATCC MYA-4626 / FGSC 10389) TaxID=936046 RepID=UPI00029F7074|nr:hypothetical protein AGABI2DRAFT_190209 [Agaricus bisporus var. bisporus H97]EKV49749.1 hypothetical protein AGABI2DRAFT_190209 [Agaricus bisporus var. bisporus H97]
MDNNSMQGSPSSSSRKRPREGETESQRIKREKAAERQRRKRERDRNAAVGMMSYSSETNQQQQQQQHQQHPPPPTHHPLQQQPQHIPPPPPPVNTADIQQPELSQTEIERRDRVRAAARERQRKHRRMVKERKMRELGLDMGNDMMQPMEDVHYRNPPEAQYPPVIPHDLQQIPPPHAPIPHEPPFPQGPPIGGQTFASTLLLSFSCAPLLKQHLLRTLNMTNEELASLEPVIAEAWDRWDHQRRIHYAEQAAKGAGPPPANFIPLTHDEHGNPTSFGAPPPPPPPSTGDPNANEFRARFHRPLLAQPPFRAYATDGGQQQTQTAAPPATTPATNSAEAIDPHLSGGNAKSETRS